jgi:hypothetical protein
MIMKTDLTVTNHGAAFLVTPTTERGVEWIKNKDHYVNDLRGVVRLVLKARIAGLTVGRGIATGTDALASANNSLARNNKTYEEPFGQHAHAGA